VNGRPPRITFALITYRQEGLVEAAVQGALAQDYPDLEIIISDDRSPDGTFERIQSAVAAQSRPVIVRQSEVNRGLIGHLQDVAAIASSEFIVIAAGDDISNAERSAVLFEEWQATGGGPAVLYSDYVPLDLHGVELKSVDGEVYKGSHNLATMARGIAQVHGGTAAFTRDLFTRFSPISSAVVFEDRVLPFRALLAGGVVRYVDRKLVRYRIEGGISRTDGVEPDYLHGFTIKAERRNLADATQRLMDAIQLKPDDTALLQACTATVQQHLTRIAFAESRRGHYELVLARRLLGAGRLAGLFRTYARYRLSFLAKLRRRMMVRRWQRART
jgi:glycosyltransferase involved in cell wall biosynthesis